MTTPWIGITTYRAANTAGNSIHSINEAYVSSISNTGAIPVIIPLGLDKKQLEGLLSRLDGVLFSGGGDVHPKIYNSKMHPQVHDVDPDRDRLELQLFELVLDNKMPFLGICRGLQLINVGLGGTLYEDLKDQFPGALPHDSPESWRRDKFAHNVKILPSTRLSDIMQKDLVEVNSWHHQGIRRLAEGLKSAAEAPDGLIEAVEITDHPFGLAVQWHPEWLQDHEKMRSLFRDFVLAASQSSIQGTR